MTNVDQLVRRGIELVSSGNRDDLRRRLQQTAQRIADPITRVVVVGEFKQGKSKLINALVNAPVCPVDDDIATCVPTMVAYGAQPSAVILIPEPDAADGSGSVRREEVGIDEIADYVSESGNPGNGRELVAAEVFLPRGILDDGLALIDSPGMGRVGSVHSLATLAQLALADAVIFVSDASREYIEPEIRFLRQALRICPNVACVLSKIDLYPDWRRIAEIDRGHLAAVSADIRLFPVSSDLRLDAASEEDAELNAESGFPALVTYLRRDVLGEAELLRRRTVAQDVYAVTEHVRLSLRSELGALTDPAATSAALERAKTLSDDLRQRTSRWQVTLSDEMGDLISDMEHDLRDRMRSILREAEDSIDEGDPGPVWDQMTDWLEQRIIASLSDTFIWTSERARWLSAQVAEQFARDSVPLPVLQIDNTDDLLEPVEIVPLLDGERIGIVEKVLIGMRGSYGGVLMVGLVTSILGMALINPLSVAAGVLLGTKAYHDDKIKRLKRRQAEAKALVRRQIDDVVFQVGKQLKDRLRLVQRATRDHFTNLADEYRRSLEESVLAAQQAAKTLSAEREGRAQELRGELARVDALRADAAAVARPVREPAAIAAP